MSEVTEKIIYGDEEISETCVDLFRQGYLPKIIIWTRDPAGNPKRASVLVTSEIEKLKVFDLLGDVIQKISPSLMN